MVSSATVAAVDEVDKQRNFFLVVGDYRKEMTLKCKTDAQRREWVARLRAAHLRIIKEQKGHAAVDAFTRAANRAGSDLCVV